MATQNDDPLADLATVRDEIRRTEDETLPRLRDRRNELICIAREHGAIGDALSEASGLSRQSVHTVLRDNHVPAPNRPHSAARQSQRARIDLRRALTAAGIDPENVTAEAVRSALHTEHRTERT